MSGSSRHATLLSLTVLCLASCGDAPDPAPPCAAAWRDLNGEVRHTFTHFHLILNVATATVPQDTRPERGTFLPPDAFRPSDLPTVMRKVFDLARDALT